LLIGAVRRLAGAGGDPVVQLQTIFGGGKEAFARIQANDEKATSPGDRLRELFDTYGPCLILIDEWVAYARQLHDASDLPAGSFFEPLVDKAQFVARDMTARAFYDLYRTQQQEFPPECHETEYERRLKAAYPIHPEVFDRLYNERIVTENARTLKFKSQGFEEE